MRAAAVMAVCLLAACSTTRQNAAPATAPRASVIAAPVVFDDATSQQDYWRAASRLGYGPSPADMGQAPTRQADVRRWAQEQLAAARLASQQAIVFQADTPAPLRGFNAPLSDLAQQYSEERKARQMVDADSKTNSATQPDALNFSRDMARGAAVWRMSACSNSGVENPVLARMTEFWFNHLNVFVGKGAVRPFVGHYVVNAIRPNALGKFEDLLLASAKHPAMLLYLDQAQSVAPGAGAGAGAGQANANRRGLNENYARELMELHTLGAQGGYQQTDVRELARVLTGWTVRLQADGNFFFADRLHDQGRKEILGRTFTANGVREGEDAIRMLARHPATARRIALRLAQFFVADEPPPALVDLLTAKFLQTQGDIFETMQALAASPEFWDAKNVLFKTPLDYACSVLTATGGVRERRDIEQSLGFLAVAGQPMHGWQTPDGYKTDAATWLAPEALTRRADFAVAVGARTSSADFVLRWLKPASRARLASEAAAQRAGLALAAPEFMNK